MISNIGCHVLAYEDPDAKALLALPDKAYSSFRYKENYQIEAFES